MNNRHAVTQHCLTAQMRTPRQAWPLRLARQLWRWLQLAHERRQLAALSDAALKDLGLNRGEVFQESERPFWDDPLGK